MKNALQILPAAQTMSSLEIAKLTGKDHSKVLADIKRILDEVEINHAVFGSVYKAKNGQNQPCFNLHRRECDLIIAGYSAKYRLAIIDRWQELEAKEQLKISDKQLRSELRLEFRPMTDAIVNSREGKEVKFYHFSTEADLINRIVFGCSSAKFRVEHDIDKNDSIRDYLTFEQKQCVLAMQRANTVYLLEGMAYDERKERLTAFYNRQHKTKLIDEQMRLGA